MSNTTIGNISDLRASTIYGTITPPFSLTLLGYYQDNDGGGGDFFWDDSSTEDDNNGTIIKPNGIDPADPGRWKRLLLKNEINVRWFGAKGDNTGDDLAAFDASIKALTTFEYPPFFQSNGQVYVPRGTYALSDTWVIDTGVNIRGDAGNGTSIIETVLSFPTDTVGIWITAPKVTIPFEVGSSGCIIENIGLLSAGGSDESAHGFKIKGNTVIKYCRASYFPGNGFDFFTDGIPESGDAFGNAAFTIVEHCRAEFNLNGFRTKGGDANVILFLNNDATVNYRWGYREDGFLGNTYINNLSQKHYCYSRTLLFSI
jgi:Pectate lyase superfamily protein